ncbi:uncharacterized protein [Henckelia pumila]|uniref:uncharacterized protein n=1 Tax=Henckelia pumila TaxID=405737 RepID=UPI003C6DD3DA
MKEHLANLPILVKPEPGEKLWVYISTTEFAVSTVLIKEEGGDQKPVYYVSHALKGPEIRYSEMEKMALALILTARKLRPYFLSHPVTVLTNSPLGQEEVWRVFVDEASSMEGSGVGVILISPTQEKTKVAIRLSSFRSNNEAEYEAVISGLKLARDAGAGHGEEFSSWSIEQIPREHNAEADALARMASSLTSIDSRETGIRPEEEAHARKLKRQVTRFTLVNEKLYRRSFLGPLLRCLAKEEVGYVLQEIHEGCCGDHGGALSLARRTLLAGYWWPTLQQDARQVVKTCEGCQRFGNFSHKPAAESQTAPMMWLS